MILYQRKCSTTQQNIIQIVQISFVGCLETLPSMMKLRRRTPTCTTGSSSAALLVENLNLIHRTGMTFPLLVLRSGTEKLLIQTSNISNVYFILFLMLYPSVSFFHVMKQKSWSADLWMLTKC